MIIIDTDVLTLVDWGQSVASNRVTTRLVASGDPIRVTIISIEEKLRGWMARIAKAKSLERQVDAYARLKRFMIDTRDFEILDFDDQSAQVFSRLRKSRIRIGTMDLRIAAIAIANNALLISRNLTDFAKGPGLRVEDWTVGA